MTDTSDAEEGSRARRGATASGWQELLVQAALLVVFIALLASFYDFDKMASQGLLLGDDGDPRFAGAILEHWYRVLHGAAAWHSPAFDYPAPGVLGYSDGFVLFVPAYAASRLAGADPYLALTQTILIIPVIGYVALVLFFRRVMSLDLIGSTLLAGAGMISANYFAFALWPQNLAICLVPLVMLPIGTALRRASLGESTARYDIAGFVGGLLAGLLALTSFYIFWFVGLLLVVLSLSLVFLFAASAGFVARAHRAEAISAGSTLLVKYRPALISIAAGLALGVTPALLIYLPPVLDHGGFPRTEALGRLRPWPPAPPEGVAKMLDWTRRGFMPMPYGGVVMLAFAALAALAAFARHRPYLRLAALAGLLTGAILILSLYRTGDWTLWSAFRSIPGGSVIRDPNRLALVLHLAAVVVLGAVAAGLAHRPQWGYRAALWGLYGLVALAVFDDWRRIRPPVQRLPRAEYFAVIAAPVEVAESCRSFFIGPDGAEAQLARHPDLLQLFNLDAMYLAHRLGLPTLNGYSAWWPAGWALNEPLNPRYLDRADKWIARHKLEGVCMFDYRSRRLTPYTPDLARQRHRS